jgi:hypothetical protein
MATFHAYAKLRLHTESTVQSFEVVTTALCQALRRFRDVTCAHYQTRELPRETTARARRDAAGAHGAGPSSSRSRHAGPSLAPRRKVFNMNTTKIHSLPDYPSHVRQFGTTDSYTTQTVSTIELEYQVKLINLQSELAHRLSKMWYALSNKNKKFVAQVANKENRARFYRDLKKRLDDTRGGGDEQAPGAAASASERTQHITGDDDLQLTDPKERYHIGTRATIQHDLLSWLHDNLQDPAFKVCLCYLPELG